MTTQQWTSGAATAEILRLITPGVLGFYTHVEATEVFAVNKAGGPSICVLSIVVAEDRESEPPQPFEFLSGKLFRLKSLKGWSFGVARYTRPISELIPALDGLRNTHQWRLSGEPKPLTFGEAIPEPSLFVPSDAALPIPLNRVLKNNFWSGSHVFEWADREKGQLQPLYDNATRLQELSDTVQKWVPLGLASLSDRLGNLIVQLPVTVLIGDFKGDKRSNNFLADIAWHPKATARPLRASCGMEFDGAITGYISTSAAAPRTVLQTYAERGDHRGIIWDDQNHIILAATAASSFLTGFALNMQIAGSEPRVFTTTDASGSPKPHRIELVQASNTKLAKSDPMGGHIRRRMYRDELTQLVRERRFKQYKPEGRNLADVHEEALQDLRYLINTHAQDGAWLWDPYLSAQDIIGTLFHCQFTGVDLKALTGAQEPPTGTTSSSGADFVTRQQSILNGLQCNWQGLCLEYRVRRGPVGWGFHDRFLIFPKAGMGALAWSLGTSVNSLGYEHHILQKVDDGQLIMDAFLELWGELNKPQHLVWKKP